MDSAFVLPLGTLVECDDFSSIVVGDDLLLVFDTQLQGYININDQFRIESRGSNDWAITTSIYYDYGIRRDWNGNITTYIFLDPYEGWDDLDWWWDEFYEYDLDFDVYDDYRKFNNPDRNPRFRNFSCGQHK